MVSATPSECVSCVLPCLRRKTSSQRQTGKAEARDQLFVRGSVFVCVCESEYIYMLCVCDLLNVMCYTQ